jgi:ABC-type glycerol-3-phosphate transport system permease component
MGTGSVSVVMAGVVISLAIVLGVYVIGQRYLIEGLTTGSLKS